jgi:hypothetical protein
VFYLSTGQPWHPKHHGIFLGYQGQGSPGVLMVGQAGVCSHSFQMEK